MQFIVPKFIERKTRIVGPFTFGHLIFLGVAGAISFFLYITVPFSTFVIAATFLFALALVLIFVKVEKIPLPTLIKNSFVFLAKPKVYLWKKKTTLPKIIIEPEEKEIKEEKEEKSSLKITEQSRLKNLSTRLESKSR